MWGRILIGIIAAIVLGGINLFVYRRTVADTIKSIWVRRTMAALLALLFLAVPVSRLAYGKELPPAWGTTAVLIGWGVFLYTLMALLLVEGPLWGVVAARWLNRWRRKFPSPTPLPAPEDPAKRLFLSRAAAAGALAVGCGAGSLGTWRAFSPPEISEVPVKLPGLPKALEGFTIVQLSDLHIGPIIQAKFIDQLVAVANSAKGDLVAITGDLVDASPHAIGRYVARLRNLKSRFGTFFVSGNHDYYSGWERWAPELEGLDFEVLRNRTLAIGEPGASFDLIGVDDYGSRWSRNGYDLGAATQGRDLERPSVLLAHQPNGLELAAQMRVGLQLSGHTHGGQLFPATLIGSVAWGSRNEGLSIHQGTQLYTSRGCGFVGPPMRLGAPPEVVKIVLLAA